MKNVASSFSEKTLDDKVQFVLVWVIRAMSVMLLLYSIISLEYIDIINSLIGVILLFSPEFIERRYKVTLPIEYSFTIVVFIFGAIILGGVRSYYDRFWWWDDFLHTTSGVLLGFAGFLVLYVFYYLKKLQADPWLITFLAFAFAATMGVLWEVFEFLSDQLLNTSLQNGSLTDTMVDLIVDCVGALFSVLLGYRFLKYGKKGSWFGHFLHKFLHENPKIDSKK